MKRFHHIQFFLDVPAWYKAITIKTSSSSPPLTVCTIFILLLLSALASPECAGRKLMLTMYAFSLYL